jgi:very-short-patch-repair endonuclease
MSHPVTSLGGMREINDLAQKAATQQGLLTSSDLLELGVTEAERATLVSKGCLQRCRRGLFVLAGTPVTWEHEIMRACLSAARRGVASHRTALRLWDLWRFGRVIDVTVRGLAAPHVDGAVVHRTWDLEPDDVTWVNGIPVTSVPRTLVDAGVYLSKRRVEDLVDGAIGTGLVSVADIRRFRERVGRHGRTGVGKIQQVLDALPEDIESTESPKEIALLRLTRTHGLPAPVTQFPVVARGQGFRVDLAYPDARVLLEYDGYLEHIDPVRFARDRERQNLLVLDGWHVLRFTKVDLRDREARVAAQIREAIGSPRLNLR